MSYDSNLERDEYPQQYDHDYYGQSNYNQELEIDRHKMSYDSNLERNEYPQQYSCEYYGIFPHSSVKFTKLLIALLTLES